MWQLQALIDLTYPKALDLAGNVDHTLQGGLRILSALLQSGVASLPPTAPLTSCSRRYPLDTNPGGGSATCLRRIFALEQLTTIPLLPWRSCCRHNNSYTHEWPHDMCSPGPVAYKIAASVPPNIGAKYRSDTCAHTIFEVALGKVGLAIPSSVGFLEREIGRRARGGMKHREASSGPETQSEAVSTETKKCEFVASRNPTVLGVAKRRRRFPLVPSTRACRWRSWRAPEVECGRSWERKRVQRNVGLS